MKTVNRGKLLRLAKAGKLVSVNSYHFDDMHGESRRSEPLPVQVITSGSEFKHGFCNLYESDFKTKSGCAYENGNGTITLIVHSNSNFDLKVVEGDGK